MKRTFILFITVIIFLPACSSSRWVRTPVIRDNDFIITAEQHQVEGDIVDAVYAHPFKIDISRLKQLMGDLTYMEQTGILGRETKKPVFQAAEIDRLAPALADVLATVDDSQRIRFTSYNRGKGLIFSVSRETEGVMFIKPENRVNIAFNFINAEIDITETTTYPAGFSRKDALTISMADTTVFPPDAYAHNHELETGMPAPLWIVADLEKMNQAISNKADHSARKEKSTVPAVTTGPAVAAPAVEKAAPVPPENTQLQKEIKNKLKYLKELLDEGLITEQDYRAKKDELLDKIN